MYADKITDSMRVAIDETNRRREKQVAYNVKHGLDPQPLRKKIADITDLISKEDEDTEMFMAEQKSGTRVPTSVRESLRSIPARDLGDLIDQLSEQMRTAASELQFEVAARLRDEVHELKKELRQMSQAGHV
jgi:excinuclease ABC subunit B